MGLTTDPAAGSWVKVGRYNEILWLQVVSAANGALFANNPMPAPMAWPALTIGQTTWGPIQYGEVLDVSASTPDLSKPGQTTPGFQAGDTTGGTGILTTDF